MSLTRGNRRFFELLRTLKTDDTLTRQQLLDATGWTDVSLRTYLNKNKLVPFLSVQQGGDFRVMRAGPALAEQEVDRALTQVSPSVLLLAEGQELSATDDVYVLDREIGRGAVGHVWDALSKSSGTRAAIKVLNPRPDLLEPTRLANIRHRFRREIKNGCRLQHISVVRHIDYGECSGQPFLVMERAWRSWGDVLATEGPVPKEDVAELIRHTLAGLSYIHARGCVHRDLKPHNLLVMPDRRTVIGDLGIVNWSDMNPEFTTAGTITRSSMQLGSWHYMAPEQQSNPHEVSPASDVYGLGVSWFELLTGAVLTPQHFAARKLPHIAAWPDAREMILRMTEFEPTARPSVSELTQESGYW